MAKRITSNRRRGLNPKREVGAKRPGDFPRSGIGAEIATTKAGEPATVEQVPIAAPAEIAGDEKIEHQTSKIENPLEPLPARMLNEFVYCPRLFYYEFVEGVFVHNADTTRGAAIHARVDSGSGAMPSPESGKSEARIPKSEIEGPETIHSRSISLGSERLGVTAKIDLVEVRPADPLASDDDLFSKREV